MKQAPKFPILVSFYHGTQNEGKESKYFEKAMSYVDNFAASGTSFGVELPSFQPDNPEWQHQFGQTKFGKLALKAQEKGMKVIPLRTHEMHERLVKATSRNLFRHMYEGKKDSMEMVNALRFHSQRGEKFGMIIAGTEHARHIFRHYPSIYVSATTPLNSFRNALPRMASFVYNRWAFLKDKTASRFSRFNEKRLIKKQARQPKRRPAMA